METKKKKLIHFTKSSVVLLTGAGVGIGILVVTFVLLLRKTKQESTSTSTSTTTPALTLTYRFPDESPYIVFTESVSSGFKSVLSALSPATLSYADANWCNSLAAQTWKFVFVSEGPDSSSNYYYIVSQNTGLTNGRYLSYKSNVSSKLGWASVPSLTELWVLTSVINAPIRSYNGNSALTLGDFRIRNLTSGLSLAYSTVTPTSPVLAVTDTNALTQLFSFHKYTSC